MEEEICQNQDEAQPNQDQGANEQMETFHQGQEDNALDDYSDMQFEQFESRAIHRSHGRSVCSIVNATKDGHRIGFANSVHDRLGNPVIVHLALTAKGLAVGAEIPGVHNPFPLMWLSGRPTVYAKGVILELSAKFNLDYSTRKSRSFTEVRFIEKEGQPIAIIPLAPEFELNPGRA